MGQRKEIGVIKRTRKEERRVPKRLPLRPCRLPVFPPEVKPELEKKNSMLRIDLKMLISKRKIYTCYERKKEARFIE